VPPTFDAWFLRATDPDIQRRFQTAREMGQTLAAVCGVTPSSLGNEYASGYPAGHPLTATRQDAPSMAAVSNTASRVPLTTSLWQRPVAKLVATTAVSTLVVTGALVFWLMRRPALDGASQPTTGSAQALTPAPPAAPPPTNTKSISGSPGIRPIQASASDGSSLDSAREVTRRDAVPVERDEAFAPAARGSEGSFDRDEAQRQVRAKLLDRPRQARGKAKRNKTTSAAASGETTSSSESSPVVPARRATKPPAAPAHAPPSESAPSLVDGRRIRTSL
jgi:hypothetical protein